ncbi:GNAT family N-acetyltransferase [Rufibacter ruber]|uniref:GNAT family N-acetyltransferase n=1 Tax=Rufibacter ruber TaxID=1783499 RepID=UPI00082E549D|nr:GNAT family N-acetyltransferase [Rufibacter ruber]
MTFSFADSATVPQLCTLFNTAFSDYVLPLVLTEAVMEMKLTRDGTHLHLSPLALNEEKEPVGFILNALGEWRGRKTAYNGGTGVVPHGRGHALTERMYQFCIPRLREQGAEQCLLEVIQENKRALAIYRRLGFAIQRTFRCFRLEKELLSWHAHLPHGVTLHKVAGPDWPRYQTFWEIEPSWQHHVAAIGRSGHYVQVVEARLQHECVGYGVVYPLTGAIAHLAVAPAWRGKGIGQALCQKLVEMVSAPAVTVVNVDAHGASLLNFVQGRGMQETLGQYEMVLDI